MPAGTRAVRLQRRHDPQREERRVQPLRSDGEPRGVTAVGVRAPRPWGPEHTQTNAPTVTVALRDGLF